MPSHTVPTALIKFWIAGGYPWQYDRWKRITGVNNGLFPPNDSDLPHGWDRTTAEQVEAYFDQFKQIPSEADKQKFASFPRSPSDPIPGRYKFRVWVVDCWKKWGVNNLILKALTETNQHPSQIMLADAQAARSQGIRIPTAFPSADDNVTLVIDTVSRVLFGEESLVSNGRLMQHLRPILSILIQRCWDNIRKQHGRSAKNVDKLRLAATTAFDELDRDKLTKAKLTSVIKAIARWKPLALVYTVDDEEKIEEMEEELERLMGELGAKVRVTRAIKQTSSGRRTRAPRVKKEEVDRLRSEQDVSDLVALYEEFFKEDPADGEPLEMNVSIGIAFAEGSDKTNTHTGVEVEAIMSSQALCHNLDFRDRRPVMFNHYRHKQGATLWNDMQAVLFSTESEDLQAIHLFWYQLAGVHAMVRLLFSPTPVIAFMPGILLADDVGLGKTFQAIAFIALLADVSYRQQNGMRLPPIIGKPPFLQSFCNTEEHLAANPYLGDSKKVPVLPHLIVVPGTLSGQWQHELKVALSPKAFELYVYPTSKADRAAFWEADGLYAQSTTLRSSRIILCTQSALEKDFQLVFQATSSSSKSALPWDHPLPLPGSAKRLPTNLYGQQYSTVVIDEAQVYRNTGNRHSQARLILEQGLTRLILTATPLQTSTKDIASMGRLIGLPYFSSAQAFQEQQADAADLRQLRPDIAEEADSFGLDVEDVDAQPYKLLQVKISQRMYPQFQGRVIRRTGQSKDPEGLPLVDLPPCEIVQCVVRLSDREMKRLTEKADIMIETAAAGNQVSRCTTTSFYLEHRMGAICPLSKPPKYHLLEEWQAEPFTKVDVCARICRHILQRDDYPPFTCEDGQIIFPPFPPLAPGLAPTKDTKILIYQEFKVFGPFLRNVLDLYGVKHVHIDGGTSFDKRTSIISRFNTDPEIRVLIFSSVGATGLNLSRANVILFLDQPWSAQDERQIRGRAHRQPQTKTVHCYHILAADTADIILATMAQGKHYMLEAFLSSAMAKSLVKVFSGNTLTPEEIDDEDNPQPFLNADVDSDAISTKPTKPKNPRKTKVKSASIIDISDQDDQAGPSTPSNSYLYRGISQNPTAGTSSEGLASELEDVHMRGTSSGHSSDYLMKTSRTDESMAGDSEVPSSPDLAAQMLLPHPPDTQASPDSPAPGLSVPPTAEGQGQRSLPPSARPSQKAKPRPPPLQTLAPQQISQPPSASSSPASSQPVSRQNSIGPDRHSTHRRPRPSPVGSRPSSIYSNVQDPPRSASPSSAQPSPSPLLSSQSNSTFPDKPQASRSSSTVPLSNINNPAIRGSLTLEELSGRAPRRDFFVRPSLAAASSSNATASSSNVTASSSNPTASSSNPAGGETSKKVSVKKGSTKRKPKLPAGGMTARDVMSQPLPDIAERRRSAAFTPASAPSTMSDVPNQFLRK